MSPFVRRGDINIQYKYKIQKNQQSQHTGSRNRMGPKMLPTIWHTYIVAEKNATKNVHIQMYVKCV
jgi:hypothetical protein